MSALNRPTGPTAPPCPYEDILNLRVLNLQPIAQALYPDLTPATASAKFHNKRKNVRYQKFSPEEAARLLAILVDQLRPIALAFTHLQQSCSTPRT